MANVRECVDYACECIRLAGLTDDPEIRDRLIIWLVLAGCCGATSSVDERSRSHHDIVDAGDG